MVLVARVVQHGSLSEAARRAGVPVSTVSRKISSLERQLGVRLLERTTRALKPTEAGREYIRYCEQVAEAIDDAQAALDRRGAEVAGALRLAAPPSLSDALLVKWIDSFTRRYTRTSVQVLVTDRHLDLVSDEVDLSLRVGRQPESSLVFRVLLRYRHLLVASPVYLAAAPPLEELSDLAQHALIGFRKWFSEVTWTLTNGRVSEQLTVRLRLGINEYGGVLSAALAGMGVVELPSFLCESELQTGALVQVLPEWQFEEVDLSAYYLSRRHTPRIVQAFLDHCSQMAAHNGAGLRAAR